MLNSFSDSGGISTFSTRSQNWTSKTTWLLPHTSDIGAELKIVHHNGDHYLIAPSREMTLEEYKSHLQTLSSKAVLLDSISAHTAPPGHQAVALAAQSQHDDRATRFVHEELASVARKRIPIPDWSENDYEYVATLARALDQGTLPLSALIWSPSAANGGWTRDGAFTAQAVSANMAHKEHEAVGDEDEEAEVGNDNAFLRNVLKLNVDGNPFVNGISA
jgi:hypothetical protein